MNVEEKMDVLCEDIKKIVNIEFTEKAFEFKYKMFYWLIGVVCLLICVMGVVHSVYIFNSSKNNKNVTYNSNGVNILIDSNGNIIVEDVTPEEWKNFLKWKEEQENGEYKSSDN